MPDRPGLGREGHKGAPRLPVFDAIFALRQRDDGAAFRRLVGAGCQISGFRQFLFADAVQRQEGGGLAVAQGDGAGLVQQQVSTSPAASTARPDMASTLKRTSRSMPAMPMADSSAPMVVGIRVTNSATSTSTVMAPPA